MRSETVHFGTFDDVVLAGDLAYPDGVPQAAIVVCHPHPLYGGNRHDSVVRALCSAALRAGCAALSFDFRGTGDSSGEHDGHGAERIDIAAAVEFLSMINSDMSVVLAGYSFGAATALNVVDDRVAAWIAIAPPLAMLNPRPIAAVSHRPKFLASPEHDQFTRFSELEAEIAGWENASLEIISGADHFMVGRFVSDHSLLDELVHRAIASST